MAGGLYRGWRSEQGLEVYTGAGGLNRGWRSIQVLEV